MITWRTRFRRAIPDPPAARRKVVVALGGNASLPPGGLDALAGLARERDVVVIETGRRAGRPLEQELRSRLPGREIVTVTIEVASGRDGPEPSEIVELSAIELLVRAGVLVVCAARDPAVIDTDLAGELLARTLGAPDFLMLTDVPAVQLGWGTAEARTIHRATPQELRGHVFAAGSMGPKVEAGCRFVERTGGTAAIGAAHDAAQILAGNAGTIIRRDLY